MGRAFYRFRRLLERGEVVCPLAIREDAGLILPDAELCCVDMADPSSTPRAATPRCFWHTICERINHVRYSMRARGDPPRIIEVYLVPLEQLFLGVLLKIPRPE